MKKFISLTLTMLMILMSIQTSVFAQGTVTEKTFAAIEDIYNLTEGEGFHHNTSAQGRVGLETDGVNVVLRQAEWICYDVSDFEKGAYNLTVKVGTTNPVPLTVLVDGVEVLSNIEVPKTGGYNTQSEILLGQIEFSGNQQKIRILNAHKLRALFISEITLKKLDPLALSSFEANVPIEDGVVARGADSFTLVMSADVDEETVKESTVMIKNENGDVLLSEVSSSGANIIIKLKESLDYEGRYTIYADGVVSETGQELEVPIEESFTVSDSTDTRGVASIEVASFEYENGLIKASGVVKSSQGLGISKRDVTLSMKSAENDYEIKATEKTVEDGVFNISYEISEDTDAGKYNVMITSDYAEDAYEEDILYFSKALDAELADAFSGLENADAVESVAETYKDYLEVDMVWAQSIISDFDAVYEKLIDKTYEKAEDAINDFKKAVYFEAVLQSEDAEEIEEILNDELKSSEFTGFNKSLWDALDNNSKAEVSALVTDMEADSLETLSESINEAVKAQLIISLGLTKSSLSFSSDEIITGENAEITVAIDKAAEDVCGMHFEIAYDEESAALFETDGFSADIPTSMTYEKKIEDNTLVIDIKAEENVSLSGNFITFTFPASGKAGGVHEAIVSGSVLYRPSVIEDENTYLEIPFDVLENPVVKVKEITSFETTAVAVIEEKEGIGFHDEPSSGGSIRGLEKSGSTSVCLRVNEWIAYDISSLAAGEYELSINYSSTSVYNLGAEVDGETKIGSKEITPTGGYSTYLSGVAGKFSLSGEQKVLKLFNYGTGATYINKITLIRVEPLKILEFDANTGVENGVVSRGTDRFTVEFSNDLNAEKISSGNVSLKEKGTTKTLDILVSVSGKKIVIDLKETFDYEEEYEIIFTDVEDKFGQKTSEKLEFSTDDETNQEGTSKIDINTWKVNGSLFEAEGTILSSSGEGIAGRKAELLVKGAEASEYSLWADVVSGEDGKFSISYTFAEDAVSAKYPAKIDYEYAQTPYRANIYYFDSELSKNIAEEFSNLKSEDDVMAKLREYEETLGISLDEISMEVNLTLLAIGMTNKNYETAAEVIEDINKLHALEKVNQAISASEVANIIDSEDALKDIGEIQREKWNILTEEEKTQIATEIFSGGRIEIPEELIEIIDEKINALLQEKYDIKAAEISLSNASVNVGQRAEINISASERTEDIVAIHIEIEYDEDSAELFESSPSVTLSKDLKNMTVKKNIKDGKAVYDFEVKQSAGAISKVYTRGDIATLSFMATGDAVGIHKPTVSGYITYHTDSDEAHQSSAYFTDVPFEVSGKLNITVAAAQTGSGNGYQGGGGSSGGKGYGTTGGVAGGTSVKAPQTTTEGITTKPMFTDAESALWAKEYIEALATKGIVSGRGDGTFAPNDSVTRAEFSKMITIALSIADGSKTCEFSDVSSDSWYYMYVASAQNAGLVNGKGNGLFAPNDTITREEMAAIAFRALGKEKIISNEVFADDSDISAYAKDAVYTLKELGIINGVGDNMFAPKVTVSRAMAAKVIYMLINA